MRLCSGDWLAASEAEMRCANEPLAVWRPPRPSAGAANAARCCCCWQACCRNSAGFSMSVTSESGILPMLCAR